jgi:hypothetical protein
MASRYQKSKIVKLPFTVDIDILSDTMVFKSNTDFTMNWKITRDCIHHKQESML